MTKRDPDGKEDKFIRNLHKGDFFGEKALQGEEKRTANIIADDAEGVTCLVIDRESFIHLISNLEDIKTRYSFKSRQFFCRDIGRSIVSGNFLSR